MLRALLPSAQHDVRRGAVTVATRWALAFFVSLSVVAPGAFASPVCGMEADGSGCARCEAKLAAPQAAGVETMPSCHATQEVKLAPASCHEQGSAGACCSLEQRDAPAAAILATFSKVSPSGEAPALAPAADWLAPVQATPSTPAATESPPGSSGLLVAQTHILRL